MRTVTPGVPVWGKHPGKLTAQPGGCQAGAVHPGHRSFRRQETIVARPNPDRADLLGSSLSAVRAGGAVIAIGAGGPIT
ncbi:hypothetical protein NJB1907f44_18330 [Mycobacterium marinum]|uniref:Uncharacterized protein n=1 Tax=Mycobacterium shottsii TaxID=133549 RepID=A0A7I7L9B9_9MYCO|nr:hypothetical protein MMRN_46070 [Mycobacterium marinum]BBX56414.1 hypothetical protein MSHO_17590 [Mycobacterium shottsii]GJN97586.1 hypothetical protein NJB1907f34b_07320 [Mycobacterium marinum]GJN99466.1 hypothetical protein NJB1808e29_18960 [Mycobacterium marinum]GJO09979.1 hypothetical protein NJB1907E90_27810 [Mycobacterium marinum]